MSDKVRPRRLLEVGRIGQLETPNRIVMSPMGTNLAEEDGQAGERLQRYYEERARGGVGLVIVGVAAVAYPAGACIPRQLAISDDRFLPGLRARASRIRQHGARAAIPLQHAGKVATRDIAAGRPLLVPSVLPETFSGMADLTADEVMRLVANLSEPGACLSYHALEVPEIETVVESFAAAAERARRAGFDGVEIHAGHGYLIAEFLSRATNHRTDAYGVSIEGRARLLVEIIHAVKERVGRDFPVWCRLDAHEYRIENGITLAESCETAQMAEAAGADAIHVSAYGNPYSGIAFTEAPLVHEPGGFLLFAEAIKRCVDVPVIAVGRITPAAGERAIEDGTADFVAMGRALLADPGLPAKIATGRQEDIRPCIYCYTCVGRIFVNESVTCAVNPTVGREEEMKIEPAPAPRTVLVVGGGPAGMEAARVAALRGHRVVLCERERRLGGALFFASLLWEPNGALLRWLDTQIRNLPIEIRLGTVVTPELVRKVRPDALLVATGARHEHPPIPGADRPHVLGAETLRRMLAGGVDESSEEAQVPLWQRALLEAARTVGALDRPGLVRMLSHRWMPIGTRVVVIGGGLVGVELAAFLCERGRTVTVLEENPWFAPEMAIPRRWRALHELREHGVELRTEVRVEEITDEGVVVSGDGERQTLAADHVILATAPKSDPTSAEKFAGAAPEVHVIGDCSEVGYIAGAIASGNRIGLAL